MFDAATQLGVPAIDVAWLLERLFTLLSSCDERRVEQWDLQSWWDYVQADKRSPAFRRYLADGLTRTLVAARAKEMSARTGGLISSSSCSTSRAPASARTACSTRRRGGLDRAVDRVPAGPRVEVRLGEAVEGIAVRDGGSPA